MISMKNSTIDPILSSSGGFHLTAYINCGLGIEYTKLQISKNIADAKCVLSKIMLPSETERFLKPLTDLLEDASVLKRISGNIGIFRTKNMFRILALPVSVENTLVVATSFHIKPLLRWMQMERDFLFVGLTKHSAALYQGNLNSFRHIDDAIYSSSHNQAVQEALYSLSQWISDMTIEHRPRLFISGEADIVRQFKGYLDYENMHSSVIRPQYSGLNAKEVCANIRSILRKEALISLESTILDFHEAHSLSLVQKNIFEIAKAAVQGKVKKLLITDELNIFGKLDKRTGSLSIHHDHLDHEDDCVLDDLAQEVISLGGEVVVAKKSEIPKGRAILALVEEPDAGAAYSLSHLMPSANMISRAV